MKVDILDLAKQKNHRSKSRQESYIPCQKFCFYYDV
nr:MAG TPA: Protein of unknown function (DUF1496) [Caudoviricetes sp.]